MSSVLKIMRTPLSDSDIRKILGNDIKIIVYPDLSKYSNLGDLSPANRDCCIILYELKQLSGHWTCLTRDGDLFFEDPRPSSCTSIATNNLANRIRYTPQVGKLVLFPGWLPHGIMTNTTDNKRVSLSFNISF